MKPLLPRQKEELRRAGRRIDVANHLSCGHSLISVMLVMVYPPGQRLLHTTTARSR